MLGQHLAGPADEPGGGLVSGCGQQVDEPQHLEDGEPRRLTRPEVLGFVNLLAAAGNETTTRLIGWTGKVLAEHPEQLAMLVEDRDLVPNAVEEILRFEPPSPVQARYVTTDVEHHGQVVPAGSAMLLLNGSGNRDDRKFPD